MDKDGDGKFWAAFHNSLVNHAFAFFLEVCPYQFPGNVVVRAGKMSMAEFQATTARKFKEYFANLRHAQSTVRSRISSQSWVWHDDDELLQYEDLLQDYHDRSGHQLLHSRDTYLTSPPLVSGGRHGHANSVKVKIKFISSASAVFLVHNWCCGKCIDLISTCQG